MTSLTAISTDRGAAHQQGRSAPFRLRCTAVTQSDAAFAPAEEPAEFPVCPTCKGEGGSGDDRCAIMICPDCEGSGLWRPGSPCPCGSGVRGDRLDPSAGYEHVIGCPNS
jgi:hypothetical protein